MPPITCYVYIEHLKIHGNGMSIILEKMDQYGVFIPVSTAQTSCEGFCDFLVRRGYFLAPGLYRLTVDTRTFCVANNIRYDFPFIPVTFWVTNPQAQYHIRIVIYEKSYTVGSLQ